jgi:hypothetical protein
MTKQALRTYLASLSFSEKVKILEKLRDRSIAISQAGLRPNPVAVCSGNADQFCTCLGWEPCACGNQPPYHCMLCCRELSPEQIAAARARGFYKHEEIEE